MNDWETMKQRFAEIAKDVKPVPRGEVGIWYDNAGRYCDVIWNGAFAFFAGTEHKDVMALTNDAGNLHGFKIDAVDRMGDGNGGYTTVDLRNRPGPKDADGHRNAGTNGQESITDNAGGDNHVAKDVIGARYNHDSHSFDVVWSDRGSRYIETENSHILALVDSYGSLCGFRVIRTDLLGDDEHGIAHARMKTRTAANVA